MIAPNAFASLRLSDFLCPQDVTQLTDWEYLDRMWVGEAHGFSEWLRLEAAPDRLAALSLDLLNFPPAALDQVLARLELPLRPGMEPCEVEPHLGQALGERRFGRDRITHQYAVGTDYQVECTFRDQGGLTYINLNLNLPTSR